MNDSSNRQRALSACRAAAVKLANVGIEEPLKEAEALALKAANLDINRLYRDNPYLDENAFQTFQSFIHRRLLHEPIHYILGAVDFLELNLAVGDNVLIPRPETELLALKAIALIESLSPLNPSFRVLDLCAGSGCLALAIAKRFPNISVFGLDISYKALAYARLNRNAASCENCFFVQGDLLLPLNLFAFDVIVSNPPYIQSDELKNLPQTIRDWEPLTALDGGKDGLDFYRRTLSVASRYLKKNGAILFEIGYGQSDSVQTIALQNGFHHVTMAQDYSGITRIITIRGQ
jgi:release factor glutamine methyltransferase